MIRGILLICFYKDITYENENSGDNDFSDTVDQLNTIFDVKRDSNWKKAKKER